MRNANIIAFLEQLYEVKKKNNTKTNFHAVSSFNVSMLSISKWKNQHMLKYKISFEIEAQEKALIVFSD